MTNVNIYLLLIIIIYYRIHIIITIIISYVTGSVHVCLLFNKKTKKHLASQKETELIGDRKDCSNEAIEWNLGPNVPAA